MASEYFWMNYQRITTMKLLKTYHAARPVAWVRQVYEYPQLAIKHYWTTSLSNPPFRSKPMTYQPKPHEQRIRVRYPGQDGKLQEGVLLAVHGDGAYAQSHNGPVLVPTQDVVVLSRLVQGDLQEDEA